MASAKNFILAESFKRANISNALYYAMNDEDKEEVKDLGTTSFGDQVYIITTGKTYIMGNDGQWYPM